MTIYKWCVKCGNSTDEDKIYRCRRCNHQYCEACPIPEDKVRIFGVFKRCPACDAIESDTLGKIQSD
jgi:hypothetical protein